MQHNKFRPERKLEFWCSECDNKVVNSEDTHSGTFYITFGHVYDFNRHEIGDYEPVIWALCPDCRSTQ